MNRCPGFTVVELTIVLGIMAILLAISSLNLSVLGPKSSLENTFIKNTADFIKY